MKELAASFAVFMLFAFGYWCGEEISSAQRTHKQRIEVLESRLIEMQREINRLRVERQIRGLTPEPTPPIPITPPEDV